MEKDVFESLMESVVFVNFDKVVKAVMKPKRNTRN